MNNKIKEIKDDLMDRAGHWVPMAIAGVIVYVLLNIWPSFGVGMGVGVAGTWIYRMYFNPKTRQLGT